MSFLEALLSKSYFTRKAEDEKAQQYQQGLMELIGQPQQAQSQATGLLGGDQPMQIDAQISQPTGLLGGQMTPQQFALQTEALGSGIWGKDFAQPMARQRLSGAQAMSRQMQGQQYGKPAELFDDEIAGYGKYLSDTARHMPAIENANVAMDMVQEVKGIENLTGPEQLGVLYGTMRAMKPEATSDAEYDNLLQQFGIKGSFGQVANFLNSKGKLGTTEMTQIYNTLQSIAKSRGRDLERINQQHMRRGRSRGYEPQYLVPTRQYSRKATTGAAPQLGETRPGGIPASAKPYTGM